jgi:undecaprenyl diphosphate synthase
MDGNGRWAKQQGLLRALGHESGTKSVKIIIKTCAKLAIENLTLYAFSTENWNRPKIEVDTLMKILIIKKRASHPTGKQHQIKHDSNLEKLPQSAQKSYLT